MVHGDDCRAKLHPPGQRTDQCPVQVDSSPSARLERRSGASAASSDSREEDNLAQAARHLNPDAPVQGAISSVQPEPAA
eukprot:8394840-Heterocapsa_arctica.AAC.1